jgi:hypothetical protein
MDPLPITLQWLNKTNEKVKNQKSFLVTLRDASAEQVGARKVLHAPAASEQAPKLRPVEVRSDGEL